MIQRKEDMDRAEQAAPAISTLSQSGRLLGEGAWGTRRAWVKAYRYRRAYWSVYPDDTVRPASNYEVEQAAK